MIPVIKEELIQCCVCGKTSPLKMGLDKINNNDKPYVCNICCREGSSQEGDEASAIESEMALNGVDRTSKFGEDLNFPRSATGVNGNSSFRRDQKSSRNDAGGSGTSSLKRGIIFSRAGSKGYSILGSDLTSLPGKDGDDSSLQGEGCLLGGDDLTVKAESESQHDNDTNHSAALTTSSKVPQLHIKAISLKNYFTCDICDKIFCRAFSLKRHQRVHNKDRPFCCDVCGKAFSSRFGRNQHGRVHLTTEITISRKSSASAKRPRTSDAKCSICSLSLPDKSSLARHLREVHSGEKGFICNVCGEGLSTVYSLKRHESRHTMKETTVSSKSSSFVRHNKVGKTLTPDAEELECRLCNQFLPRASSLIRHVRQVHPGMKPFSCKICGKGFLNSFNLKRHVSLHTMTRTTISKESSSSIKRLHTNYVECRFCGQSLPGASALIRHVRQAHPGKKPYSCQICGKGFLNPFNLKRHGRLCHSKKETNISEESSASLKLPHTCDVECQTCGQFLPSTSSLARHVGKVHPREKAVNCNICGEEFSTMFNLKRHESIHTIKETPFFKESPASAKLPHTTDVEGQSIGQSQPRATCPTLHVRRDHPGENAYSCDPCGKAFHHLYDLRRHEKSHTDKINHSKVSETPTCSVEQIESRIGGLFLPSASTQARHVRKAHPAEKMYSCKICGKAFTRLDNLKRHQNLHEEKIFKKRASGSLNCDICGKFFSRKDCLKRHRRIHIIKKVDTSGKSATVTKSLQVKQECLSGSQENHERETNDAFSLTSHSRCNVMESNDGNENGDALPSHQQSNFECVMCDKTFQSVPSLQRHNVDVHSLDNFFDFDICAKSFSCQRSLRRHDIVHNQNETTAVGELSSHTENSLEKRTNVENKICSDVQVHPNLNEHSQVAHDDDGKVISVVEFPSNRYSLEGQDAVHIKQEPFDVDASQGVHESPSLDRLNKTVGSVCIKPEHCDSDDLCGESSQPSSSEIPPRASSSISRHRRVQADKTSFKCGKCEQVFAQELDLRSHQRSHQNIHPNKKTFMCEICGKSLADKFTHFEHQRIHTNEQPYTCDICYRPIRYWGSFKKHMKLHEKDDSSQRELYQMMDRNLSKTRFFVCRICQKSFKRTTSLKRHYSEVHTKKTKMFGCEFCDKSYVSEYRLKFHKSRVHSRDRPLLCEVCGKRFFALSLLKLHQRMHNGEKPYSCKLCGTSFNQPNSLTRHERIHSNEKPYVCERCGRAFSQDSSLKRHQKVHEKWSKAKWDAKTDGEGDDGSETDGADSEGEDGSETDGADGGGDDGSEIDGADGEGDDGSETDGADGEGDDGS